MKNLTLLSATTLVLIIGCGESRMSLKDDDRCIQVTVPELTAPTTGPIVETRFIHEGSLCNSTIVSIGDTFFTIYGSTLKRLSGTKLYIRTNKINNVKYECFIHINKNKQLTETLKKVEL